MRTLFEIASSAWNYAISWFADGIGDSPINFSGILLFVGVTFMVIFFRWGSSILPPEPSSNRFVHTLKHIFPLRRDYWETAKQDMSLYVVNNIALAVFAVMLLPITNNVYRDWVSSNLQAFFSNHFPTLSIPASNGFAMDLTYSFFLILFSDLGRFVAHISLHKIPALWEFHKVHHSALTLNPLAFFRLHFVDIAITQVSIGIAAGCVIACFKTIFHVEPSIATLGGVAIFAAIFAFTGVLRHSHVWWSYGKKVETVLISPAMHLIHHSSDPKHFDKNFGGDFAIWDWCVGTLYRTSKKPPKGLSFGVDDGFNWSKATAWQFVWSPIERSIRIIFNRKPPTSSRSRKGNDRQAA